MRVRSVSREEAWASAGVQDAWVGLLPALNYHNLWGLNPTPCQRTGILTHSCVGREESSVTCLR